MASLAPTSASQSLAAAYSMRKVVPAYGGACIRIRNSANNEQDVNFDGNGNVDVAAMTTFANLGDGTLRLAKWYDQSGNTRTASTSQYPAITFGAITVAGAVSMPWVDFQSASNLNLSTAATFLNVGGTYNMSVFVVGGCFGWNSASTPMPRPGTYGAGRHSSMLGYGASGNILVSGMYGANGETALYGKEGVLYVEDGAPSTSRLRNIWFNQTGANVTGGSDTRTLWSGRPHGVADTASQRLMLGNNGAIQYANNGPLCEVLIFNAAGALSDSECASIAEWQREYWGSLGAAVQRTRAMVIGAGQSNAENYDKIDSASTGLTADYAMAAILRPELTTLLGGAALALADGKAQALAAGSTSILKPASSGTAPNGGLGPWPAFDGVTAAHRFWWDQDAGIPGPVLNRFVALAGMPVGYAYTRTPCLYWAQGETDAALMDAGESGSLTWANYKSCLKLVLDACRVAVKTAFNVSGTVPVIVQPIGRRGEASGSLDFSASHYRVRNIQAEVASEMTALYISPDVCHLTYDQQGTQTYIHLSKGPADQEGYYKGAKYLARAIANVVFGQSVVWKGPECASYRVSGANTVDINLTWPMGSGGSDFTTVDGSTSGIHGFEITDAVGLRAITSAVRQTATSIRLTVSGAALSGISAVNHNPFPEAIDRNKLVVDNYSLPMPLRAAQGIALAVSNSPSRRSRGRGRFARR